MYQRNRPPARVTLLIGVTGVLALGSCGDPGATPSSPAIDTTTVPIGCGGADPVPSSSTGSQNGSVPPVSGNGNGAGDAPGSVESGATGGGKSVPNGECSSVTTTSLGDSGISNAPETSPPNNSVAEDGTGGSRSGGSNTG